MDKETLIMSRMPLAPFVVCLCVAAALAAPLVAGTTGTMTGTVQTAEGQPLAGVKISLTSPSLIGGARVTATGSNGTFAAPNLPPGLYVVDAELAGFTSQHISEVRVLLDGTSDLQITLNVGDFAEKVEVVASPILLDTRRVGSTDNFTEEYLEDGAVGAENRVFQLILSHAPGVTDQSIDVVDFQAAGLPATANPLVFGSTVGENAYYVDGLENTDVATGTFALNFNYDTIEEIAFRKGGFEPEYGFASGAYVNLITKSGGNQFVSTLDVRYSDESFTESGKSFDADDQKNELLRPSFTIGGPAIVDRLWFFASIERIDRAFQPRGAEAARDFEGEDYLGKLTWEASPRWNMVAKLFGESTDIENANPFADAAPEARATTEQRGLVAQISATAAIGSNLLWDIAAGIQEGELNSVPPGSLAAPGFCDVLSVTCTGGRLTGNVLFADLDDRERELFKTSVTWFGGAAAQHELKAGIEWQDRSQDRRREFSGQGFFFFDPGLFLIGPGGPVGPFDGLLRSDSLAARDPSSELGSIFAQDALELGSRVSVLFGARYDQVQYENNGDDEVADMDRVQPRVGVTWQVTPDGRTLARASWGEFLHPAALYLPGVADAAPTSLSDLYISCSDLFGPSVPLGTCGQAVAAAFGTSVQTTTDPFGQDPVGWARIIPQTFTPNQIANGLDPTYSTQLIVGIERQLGARNVIELSYIDKETDDIQESTCAGNVPTPLPDAACSSLIVDNLGPLTREYEGISLTLRSRLGARSELLASYTWSESKGSIEYTQSDLVDFNVFPDHFDNRFGFLSDHRLNRVKLNGYVLLPFDLTLAVGGFFASDFHFTPVGPDGASYVDDRGARDGNDNYNLDLQLAKGFDSGRFRTELIGSVYNVLDTEKPVAVCQFTVGCQSGASLGQPTLWQLPRRFEVGLRLKFG
jgi:hypothetical protein